MECTVTGTVHQRDECRSGAHSAEVSVRWNYIVLKENKDVS